MKSLSYAFRIGTSTISKIILETCEAIWTVIRDKVFPEFNHDFWKNIAREFEEKWNFPHCRSYGWKTCYNSGMLIYLYFIILYIKKSYHNFDVNLIQAPPSSGLIYYNYKGQHSLNLFAHCMMHNIDLLSTLKQKDDKVMVGYFEIASYMLL